jgi:hypothetical protein
MIFNRLPIHISALLLSFAVTSSAGVIQYVLDPPPAPPSGVTTEAESYEYLISGFSLKANQELDIQFDPTLFASIFNGVAGPGFDLLLLQPNNPPGTPGDYSALALVDSPSWTGTFSVDFRPSGAGVPGRQEFFINQFDPNGNFLGVIDSGFTTPVPVQTSVPEPGNLSILWVVLSAAGVGRAVRRGYRSRPNGV